MQKDPRVTNRRPRHFLVGLLCSAIVWGSLAASLYGDELLLQRSFNLQDWERVPITPDLLTPEGKVRHPVGEDAAFFRLKVRKALDMRIPPGMVQVGGGNLPPTSHFGAEAISTFNLATTETSWGEWKNVRSWAANHGYDIASAGSGCGDDHPVHSVSWFDVLKWCNAKSQMEGLPPVYRVEGEIYKAGEIIPTRDESAIGYRLPTEAEWEFAARGGVHSQGFTYSGSNDLDAVGWYSANADGAACNLAFGRGTWPVRKKYPNELQLFDMSGNVSEWCWDAFHTGRSVRGGDWFGDAVGAAHTTRGSSSPEFRISFLGFRFASTPELVAHSVPEGFSLILAGSFTMGSPLEELGYSSDENPQHHVTLRRSFFLQQMPVTWSQWTRVRTWGLENGYPDLPIGRKGSHGDSRNTDNDPVTMISWTHAVKWLNAKSEMEGLQPAYRVDGAVFRTGDDVLQLICDFDSNGYRLPTEAEWEYAARGGTTTAFYSGPMTNLIECPNADAIAWYQANSGWQTHPVGLKQPNRFWLYDMSGNVSEYCWDWANRTYTDSPLIDPTGRSPGPNKITRGGTFISEALFIRSASRSGPHISSVSNTGGFRPARTAVP